MSDRKVSMYQKAIKGGVIAVLLTLGIVWLGFPYSCPGGEPQAAASVEDKSAGDVLSQLGQHGVAGAQSNSVIIGKTSTLGDQGMSSGESKTELGGLSSSALAESRSKHAARINRRIFVVSVSILSFFIVCRLLLVWQITKFRKSLPPEQNAFEH